MTLTNLFWATTYRWAGIATGGSAGLACQVQFPTQEKRPYTVCTRPSCYFVRDPSNHAAFSAGAASGFAPSEFPANRLF